MTKSNKILQFLYTTLKAVDFIFPASFNSYKMNTKCRSWISEASWNLCIQEKVDQNFQKAQLFTWKLQ